MADKTQEELYMEGWVFVTMPSGVTTAIKRTMQISGTMEEVLAEINAIQVAPAVEEIEIKP